MADRARSRSTARRRACAPSRQGPETSTYARHTGARAHAAGHARRRRWRAARSSGHSSGQALELAEVRLALLEIGVPALLAFLREVIEQRRIAGELLQARLTIAIGIERGLEATQRNGAIGEHLATPLHRLGFEPLVGNDAIHEPHVERLLRIVLAAQEPDLARLLLADDTRHVRGAVTAVEAAHLGTGLPESRIVSGNGEIADE